MTFRGGSLAGSRSGRQEAVIQPDNKVYVYLGLEKDSGQSAKIRRGLEMEGPEEEDSGFA